MNGRFIYAVGGDGHGESEWCGEAAGGVSLDPHGDGGQVRRPVPY